MLTVGSSTFDHREIFYLACFYCRCKIPSLKNDTYKRQGDWHTVLINQSIPWVKKDDEWSLSSCERYIIGNETVFDWLSHPVNVSQKSCGRWVYDKSVFQSTFITKVGKTKAFKKHFHETFP